MAHYPTFYPSLLVFERKILALPQSFEDMFSRHLFHKWIFVKFACKVQIPEQKIIAYLILRSLAVLFVIGFHIVTLIVFPQFTFKQTMFKLPHCSNYPTLPYLFLILKTPKSADLKKRTPWCCDVTPLQFGSLWALTMEGNGETGSEIWTIWEVMCNIVRILLWNGEVKTVSST